MSHIKILDGNIPVEIINDVDSDERRAIFGLAALIPRLTNRETATLVILLIEACFATTFKKFGKKVGITALQSFSQDLTNAVLTISALSPSIKLAIAIEILLQIQQGKSKHENKNDDDG